MTLLQIFLFMRTLSKLFILSAVMVGTLSCLSQKKLAEPATVISKMTDASGVKEGSLVYSLPMTVFTIKIEMERTIEIPGPYSKFAGDLLGLNRVILNEGESWSVKGISVNLHEEADPSEFYVIESNTLFNTNVLALKKEGLILDLNPALYISERNRSDNKGTYINNFHSYDLGADEYFQVQRDTVYKRVNVDSTFIRIPYLVEKKKRLTIDQLAEKAARRLMELRDGKILILTGEATVFPQNEAALNEINRLEKEYTELFTGKTWRESKTLSFQLVPKKEMVGKPVVLFTFSELTGPLTGTETKGIPVTVELVPEQKSRDITIITRQQVDPSTPKYDKLFYRIPDVVNVKISSGTETLYNSRSLIYQFGQVMQLPANYIIGK